MASYYARTFLCALFLVALPAFVQAQTTGRQQLHGHVPEIVKKLNLQPLGRLSSTNHLHLAIGLPLRNKEALDTLLQQLYDPASPQYHEYLTPEQFTEKFGPTEQDYQAVMAFAKANGLTVTTTFGNRVLLDVEGTVPDIERTLHVTMRMYNHPQEARTFYAPDTEPSLDLAVPISHIGGLENYWIPHPNFKVKQASGALRVTPNAGSGPGGDYMGKDFPAAYVPGSSLNGSNQIVGLLQFDGYFSNDITYYETLAGLPNVPLTNVFVQGATIATNGSGGEVEVSLDIEMVISMAPGVSKVVLYIAPNPTPWEDLLQRMANDNYAKQISSSWTGGYPDDSTAEAALIQMAMQGQSYFNATGDSDAFTGAIPFPPDSTNVIAVGGTTLTTTGPVGSYTSEITWNWGFDNNCSCYVGSSGGISTDTPIPPWQQGVITVSNQGSTTQRNVPDVALTADNVYVRADGTDMIGVGGTSCATPLWAGFTALVNQQAVANGRPTVGFLNPAFYAIGKGPNYAACFHDITTGNNEWPSSPSQFSAVTGYDLCTGWGTPNGTNLINALTAISPILSVSSTIVSGGNGNGGIDANECNLLKILVQNSGLGTATTVNASLTTTTPGVTITQPTSSYPNVLPNTAVTNFTSFQVSTSPSFVCGTPVSFSLALSYAGGITTSTFAMATCVCPDKIINGGLTAGSPNQTGRLQRLYTVSTCSVPKTCPGNLTTSGAYHYQSYSFTNTTSNPLCITVTINTPCQGQSTTGLITTAYLGNYTPNNLCLGYLADQGGMLTTSGTYSFNVPANTNFTVVVNDVTVAAICSSFTLDVAGLPCLTDGGGACAVAGPTANFSGSPTSGTAPLPVTFTDTSSGTISNRFWDFGDSSTTNTTTNAVAHTYAAGVYTVQLVVSGPGGVSTNTKPNYITVLTPFQAWQIQYFGSTNNPNAAPGVDADGTGQNNLFKYVTGLDPTNPASIFILQIATVTNQTAQNNLLFNPLASGRTYTPQFNTDLVNGSWMPLIYFSGPVTNGNQATITDTNAIEPNKFYRLDISLP